MNREQNRAKMFTGERKDESGEQKQAKMFTGGRKYESGEQKRAKMFTGIRERKEWLSEEEFEDGLVRS